VYFLYSNLKEDIDMAKAKYKQGADGFFQTKVWDGTYNENGTKHRITLRSKKSSRDLERQVQEMDQKVRDRKYIRQSDICIPEYARKWLDVYKAGMEQNTRTMYTNIIEKHLIVLEHVKINDIAKIHVLAVLNNAIGKNRTQEQILMTLKQVVKSAISDKLLAGNVYDELFKDVSVKKIRTEKRPLTESEKAAVFHATLAPMDQAFLYIIYGCGLRRGEALALTRFDFNFRDRKLTVNKAVAFDENEPYLKGTKNGKERTVPIPTSVLFFLESYCSGLSGQKLFRARGKDYMTKSSYDKMWARILKGLNAAGAEADGLTAHVFRHNYCTSLCYQIPAVSIKMIAQLLGDTEKMVIEVYNHILLEKEDTASAIEKALNF
jgi:integrase